MFKNWMLTEIPHLSVTAAWLYQLHYHLIVCSTRNVQSCHFSYLLDMKVLFINERMNWEVCGEFNTIFKFLMNEWNLLFHSFWVNRLVPVYMCTSGNPLKWRWNLSLFSWQRNSRQKCLSGFLQPGRPLISRPTASAANSVQRGVVHLPQDPHV